MKKIIWMFLLSLFSIIPVWADEYKTLTYIPVDHIATVHTDKFDYRDFSFLTTVDDNNHHLLVFDSIHNNSRIRSSVSINLLIFDSNKKNIGYLSYCSDKDMSSIYSGFKIDGGNTSPFQIIIDSSYFVEGKGIMDASYVVVLDENKYCKISDSSQYAGLTLEEIINGPEESSFSLWIRDFFSNTKLLLIILISIIVVVVLVGLGFLLNVLHRKMYGKKTILSFLPITNIFISMKMAFGKIVALVYIIFLLISAIAYYFNIKILLYIFLGLFAFSLIIVIIKIITKKYDLLYLEPSIHTDNSVFTSNDLPSDTVSLDYNDLTSSDTQMTLEDSMKRNDSNDLLSSLNDFDDDIDDDDDNNDSDFMDF